MEGNETRRLWDRFDEDIKNLGAELKRHYEGAGEERRTAELNRSLEQLRQAADSVFKSVETATKDPEVRSRTKQAAQSFGTALGQTFRELGDEIEKAVRKTAEKK
jgi:hypothetical protein